MELTSTIDPRFARPMSLDAPCTVLRAPTRFTPNVSATSSGEIMPNRSWRRMPAFATAMSRRWNRSNTSRNMAARLAGSLTSHAKPTASTPKSERSCAARSAAASAEARPHTTTAIPSRARARAVAQPMPRVDPVTRATGASLIEVDPMALQDVDTRREAAEAKNIVDVEHDVECHLDRRDESEVGQRIPLRDGAVLESGDVEAGRQPECCHERVLETIERQGDHLS